LGLLKAHDLIASPAFIIMKAADEFKDKTMAPNQLWQTDFTYLKVIGWGWFYLSTVLDDFSRYIIAWKLCTTMKTEDVTATLELALKVSGGRHLRIMFADEVRFGRINRPRPCWAPIGIRPKVASQLIREYIYLYGAVSPKDGTCVYLIMPTSNTECFQVFLEVLARKFARQDILLVLDGAPNHRCGDLAVPDSIPLLYLPPYSPELNPKENLWDEIREKIFKN